MSGVWDSFHQFRKSRLAGTLVSIAFLLLGLYDIVILSGVVYLGLGLLFLVVGSLGLYNQLLGESIIETVKKRS
jgi:hypothetical protein